MIRLYNPEALTIEYFDGSGRTIKVEGNVVKLYNGFDDYALKIFRFPDGTSARIVRLFMDSLAQIDDGLIDLCELFAQARIEDERQKTFRIDDWPKTKDEAKARRYAHSECSPEGVAFDPSRCAAQEPHVYTFHQCLRSPGYGPDYLYCKRHAKMLEEFLRNSNQ